MKNNPIIWVVKNLYIKFHIIIYSLFLLGSGNILYGFSIIHQQDNAIQSSDYTALKDFSRFVFPKYDKTFQGNYEVNLQGILPSGQTESMNPQSASTLLMIIIILVSIIAVQFLYTRFFLIEPLKKMRRQLNQIMEAEENYGDQLPHPVNRVLSDICESINTMSSSLQIHKQDMENLVRLRVTNLNNLNERLNEELEIYHSQNQKLRENEARFNMIVRNPNIGIFEIDSSGRLIFTNRAFDRIFDHYHEELKHKKFQALVPTQFEADIAVKVKNFLISDETKGEMFFQNRYGKKIYVNYNVWKLRKIGALNGAWGFIEDISLQKFDFLKLQDREHLLYDFFQKLTTGIICADAENKLIQDVNHRLCHMIGYTRNEIFSFTTIQPIIPEQYHILIDKKIDEVIETGQTAEFEISLRKKNGIFFPVDVSVFLLKSEEGRYNYIIFLIHDISKHKQKEKLLTNEKKRVANYLETMIDSIIVTDIKGNNIIANQSYLNLIGYPRHNLLSRNAMDSLVPVDVPKLEEEFNSELFTKGYIKDKETNIKTKKGKTIPVLYSAKVLNDNTGQPVNLVGIIRDNRKRKKEQEIVKKISAQAEFTAKLLLTTAQPFMLFSKEGKCYNCNAAFCSMTGYSKPEILQKMNILKTLTHKDWQQRESEIIKNLITSEKPQRYEKECIRKDGAVIAVDSTLNLLPNNNNTKMYICSFMIDVTEQKNRVEKIEDDLSKKNDLLQKLSSILNREFEF